MDIPPSGAPAIPPRRFVPNLVTPPVPSRWDSCNTHPGQHHIAICKTCIHFLCRECMAQVPVMHAQCEVSVLDTNLYSTCEELTVNLSRKLKSTRRNISSFHRTLSKKRDRMIKKRNETITEIERYFSMLKEKLIRKLKHDETMLLNHLNEKVSEQDEVISKSIDDCSDILDALEETKTSVNSLERLCPTQKGNSSISFLKNVVKTAAEIETHTQSTTELEAARDGFLVLRFYVDSDAEKAVLRNKVASVEVLSSQDNEQNSGDNLEVEGINEAAYNNANSAVEDVREFQYIDDDQTDTLQVALPPTDTRSATNSPNDRDSRASTSTSSPTIPVCDIENLACGSVSSSPTNDLLNLEQSRDENEIETLETDEYPAEAHVDTETKQSLVDLPDSRSSSSQRSSIATPSPVTVNTSNSPTGNEQPGSSLVPQPTDMSSATSPSNPSTSSPSTSNSNQSIDPEEPPPPYPGFPRMQPRPNELPPPYPGPPPPPYSQNPEPSSSSDNFRRSRLLDSDALVPISPSNQHGSPSTSKLKITKVFSVNEIHDRRSAGIFALAVVRSNCFVVVDRWNKKLKYFDPSGGSFGGLIFREEPWDVTLVTADLVAVTVPKLNTLYKIKVTEQSVITTSTVTTHRKYACVSFHKGSEMFICGQVPQFGEPVIDVIGLDGGPILQTFRQDSDSRNRCVFSYPRYVKVTDEGIVIVCDWNLKCLLLFKLDGTFVGRYKGTTDFPLNEPTGMAYDAEKREIYVIDSKFSSLSAAIHTVSLSCECKDIIKWDNELRVSPAISPCRPGFAVGSKSGLVSLFTPRQSRTSFCRTQE